MAFKIDAVPKTFWEEFDKGHCAVFVGAGLSMGAGLPNWGTLLDELIEEGIRERIVTAERATDYRAALGDPTKFLMLATELKEVLGNTFEDYIEKRFFEHCPEPTETHRKLISIDKFPFIITTNYDVLIEKAFTEQMKRPLVLTYKDASQIQRNLHKRAPFLLKAHGTAERAASEIILTEQDYRRILYREPAYRSALEAIFTMYSVVFIGSSLRDPEVNLLLQYINAAFSDGGSGGPTHYALMAKETNSELERKRWRRDFNTHFIEISHDNDFSDQKEFLEILRTRPPAT